MSAPRLAAVVARVAAALLLAAAPACGTDSPAPRFQEFLLACERQADCGDLDCVCGLCTARCQPARSGEDAGGSELCEAPVGVCRSPSAIPGASCGGGTLPAGLCGLTCADVTDCPAGGEGFRCQQGYCLSDTVQEGCQPADCGPAPGLPNTLCPDGHTVAGPTGRCLETESGHCTWEIVSCP